MITKSKTNVRIITLLSFFLLAASVYAQKESVKYIGINGKLTTLKDAIYMQKISSKSAKNAKVQTYVLSDSNWKQIGSESYKRENDSTWQIRGNGQNIPKKSVRTFLKQADDTWKFRDIEQGQVLRSGVAQSVVPLLLHGKVTEYYPDGNKKSVSEYQNNELVSNENWNQDGTKYIDNVFYSVDVHPTFIPGIKTLHAHVLKSFKDAGYDISSVEGSILVGFVVMENGTIRGVKTIRGLGPILNDIAVESFKSLIGQWTPAKLNGQPVRYFQVFPINFKSQENRLEFAELRGGTFHFQTQ
ncbi:MAG TPA: energy transducer TonB [Prolixibacteraceae bacterium]|nr:energy transducer TonB [Prolixibacteraceae bacterium]